MQLQDELNIKSIFIQNINDHIFEKSQLTVNILRLDKMHAVVSGNKWFKLKYWLQQAIESNYNTIATFGGAFSNHILATAYACNKQNIRCIGFIRGEEPKHYSDTLLNASALNMELKFLSRKEYAVKESVKQANGNLFFIPEGGYGKAGAKGAAEILQLVPALATYDYIVCASGTGTTIAGIANPGMPHQKCIGISVMKNNNSLEQELSFLVDDQAVHRVTVLNNYHFGGYAKHTQPLFDFMNNIWLMHNIPLDFVYTSKALYAIYDLAEKNYFPSGAKILFIHSGGLQGNRSLPREILLYH